MEKSKFLGKTSLFIRFFLKDVGRSGESCRPAEISKKSSEGGNIEKSQEDVYFFRNFSKKTWESPLKVVGNRKSRKVVGRWRSQKDVSRKKKFVEGPQEVLGKTSVTEKLDRTSVG